MVFTPPPESAGLLEGVPFHLCEPFALDAKSRFDEYDHAEGKGTRATAVPC
jgi:hypothetical protein